MRRPRAQGCHTGQQHFGCSALTPTKGVPLAALRNRRLPLRNLPLSPRDRSRQPRRISRKARASCSGSHHHDIVEHEHVDLDDLDDSAPTPAHHDDRGAGASARLASLFRHFCTPRGSSGLAVSVRRGDPRRIRPRRCRGHDGPHRMARIELPADRS